MVSGPIGFQFSQGILLEEVGALQSRLPLGAALEPWLTLSGNEPDSFFYSLAGRQFMDLSGISGIDAETDGRVMVVWDYDRDGWQDLAVVNANEPLLRIFRNRLGDLPSAEMGFVAVRLVGGNDRAEADPSRSARDACGGRIEVVSQSDLSQGSQGSRRQVMENPCGSGFASQNSRTLLIGLGARAGVEGIRVHWPSGVVQESGPVAAGTLLVVREQAGADSDGFTKSPY